MSNKDRQAITEEDYPPRLETPFSPVTEGRMSFDEYDRIAQRLYEYFQRTTEDFDPNKTASPYVDYPNVNPYHQKRFRGAVDVVVKELERASASNLPQPEARLPRRKTGKVSGKPDGGPEQGKKLGQAKDEGTRL